MESGDYVASLDTVGGRAQPTGHICTAHGVNGGTNRTTSAVRFIAVLNRTALALATSLCCWLKNENSPDPRALGTTPPLLKSSRYSTSAVLRTRSLHNTINQRLVLEDSRLRTHLITINMASTLSEEERKAEIKKERVMGLAMGEAIKYSIGSAVVVGAATLLASYKNKSFNRFMSLSAKTSFPVMAGLGMFAYKYETVQYDALYNPERWGLAQNSDKIVITKMPFHHQALNYLYDHPFYFVSAMGVPFAGFILKEQLKLKHLTLSQKIMHSRVFAQGGVLCILLATMAFTSYMDKRGRFPEPLEAGEVAAVAQEKVDFGKGSTDQARKRSTDRSSNQSA